MTPPSDFILFLGRFHPLIVHFPIALILVVGLLEIMSRFSRWKHAEAGAGIILLIAVPTSIAAALFGWLLSQAGGYDARLLDWHFWSGLATAAGVTFAGLFYWLNRRTFYRVALFATIAMLVVASHFGGSLTHGSDYLVRYAPGPVRNWFGPKRTTPGPTQTAIANAATTAQTEPSVYTALIHPVLEKNCVGCHGPEKSKGGLRVDSLEGLFKGGDNGAGVVAGKPTESLILQRMRLPLDDDDHMPPDGKPQPSADDLALIEWWVNAGAPADAPAAKLSATPVIARIVAERSGSTPSPVATQPPVGVKTVAPEPLENLKPVADQLAAELCISIAALAESEPWLQCNAGIASDAFGDTELAKLAPLARHIRWLDLAGTKVTDAGLPHVGTMTNLTRLHLQRTDISDAGLAHLKGLDQLVYLNAYNTSLTDAALEHLRALPQLRHVYLWQTKVTPEAAQAFLEARLDKEQLRRWKEQIEQLQAMIRDSQVVVDLGTAHAKDANTGPINTNCPVSGKAVDPGKTVVHEGKRIAFCCDDCKSKFEQDPKPFLAKLGLKTETAVPKPVNSKCPVSGKDVDPAKTFTYEGRLVAFCCDDCCAKFQKDPKPFLTNLPTTEAQ